MALYRWMAVAWLLVGLPTLAYGVFQLGRLVWLGYQPSYGDSAGGAVLGVFGLFATVAAVGLLQRKDWARRATLVVTTLLGAYCVSFIFMVGLHFGPVPLILSFAGLGFSVGNIVLFKTVPVRRL